METGRSLLSRLLVPSDRLDVSPAGMLRIGGHEAGSLLRDFGTPLVVVSEETLRANYRRIRDAFVGFDPELVARYDEADIERLLNDPRIIRSRAKINAAIRGAQIWLQMRDDGEDFSAWLWSFVGGEPIQTPYADYRQAPTQTEQSVAMAKALKKRGFNFCGPVIVYAFMQAVGMVNDHQTTCFRHAQVRAIASHG